MCVFRRVSHRDGYEENLKGGLTSKNLTYQYGYEKKVYPRNCWYGKLSDSQ